MAHRLYIIPAETNSEILASYGLENAPKYLNLLLSPATGNVSNNGSFFIVKILEGYDTNFDELEKMVDVIRIDRDLNTNAKLQELSIIGVDLTGITELSPVSDIQKRIIEWLDGRINTDFEGLNKVRGE